MAVNPGLSAADYAATIAAMASSHRIRRQVQILDLDHQLLEDVTGSFLDGQSNVDTDAEVSRSTTVSLFDPTRSVGFDLDSPDDGTVGPHYLLSTSRGLYVDALERWVDFPTGCCWINKPSRKGDILTLEAQGKEALARYPATKVISFTKKVKKTTAIREVLESIGETRFRFESSDAVLGAPKVLSLDSSPWQFCKEVAASMGWRLFYAADGYVVLRPPAASVHTFRYGPGGTITADLQLTLADGTPYNNARATGATPTGSKVPLMGSKRVPSTSPLYLTRNGIFIPLTYLTSNDKLTTQTQVNQLAVDSLAQVILDSQTAAWDSLVLPHLEQSDKVTLTDALDDEGTGATFSIAVNLKQFSVPLTLGSQSNGYLRRVARSTSRIVRSAA